MFTGIVQTLGKIAAIEPVPAGSRLVVDVGNWQPDSGPPKPGDSICICGVCLTLVKQDGHGLHFDVIPETLSRSSLGSLAVGHQANVEPSLTPSTPMGGHVVQGHIDGVGEVHGLSAGSDVRLTIMPPAELLDYIVPKGSIAIEGVSLTIASVDGDSFDVALIPTTLELTNLGSLKQGDKINLESDILARTVVHWMKRRQEG